METFTQATNSTLLRNLVSPELLRALLTILFGALAGGLTNTVAVWMLFHPYHPPRIGKHRIPFLHGAIPKNQDRLAAAVGRTVGDRLLTQADLTDILSAREIRDTFDDRLERFLQELLEQERGPLREILSAEVLVEVEGVLEGVADLLITRWEGWVDSPEFELFVDERTRRTLSRLADEPVSDLLTPPREEALAIAFENWAAGLVKRDGFHEAVEDYVGRAFESFLRDDRTLEEVLPAGLVNVLERGLSAYLPTAVRKLAGILEDPEARARLEAVVHELFQVFVRDLRFHQRIVARLVITDEALDRVLSSLEEEGVEHLSEMLRDPAVQEAMAGRIREAILELLQKPVPSILGRPGEENVEHARAVVSDWIVAAARNPQTRRFLAEKLRVGIGRATAGNWGDLLEAVPPERIAEVTVAAARSNPARRAYRNTLARALQGVLDRPLGRPSEQLPENAMGTLQEVLADPLWDWLQSQVPHFVQTLDVGRRVEEKVRGYPTAKMEELVRRVTERELRLIIRLGYLLGAGIGGILLAINALLG